MARSSKVGSRIRLDPGPLPPPSTSPETALDDYVVLNKDGTKKHHTNGAVPLGSGGSSIVFRAKYKDTLDRALKILDPRNDLYQNLGQASFVKTFNSEIQLLAQATHTNIAKLVDWGTLELAGTMHPYYVMDYVDGLTFPEFCQSPATSAIEFLEVLRQTLDAVVYLHTRNIMHCDIKGLNLIVRELPTAASRQLTAVLLDLGVAKTFPPVDRLQFESGETYFYSTERITAPALRPYLGKPIPRTLLHDWFPRHDLNGIGILIKDALETNLIRRLRAELGQPTLNTIEVIRDRLSFDSTDSYQSAADVARDWRKLAPTYLSPVGVSELSVSSGSLPSIATPLGSVEMTARTYRLVNHPLFQRLQILPQLDLLYLLYPGAHHSRFVHSLETYRLAKRYIAALLSDARFRVLAEPEDIEALLLRSLLHDVGHYPLAHMFEDYVEFYRTGDTGQQLPSDDDLFWVFTGVDQPATLSRFSAPFLKSLGAMASGIRGDGDDRSRTLADVLADTTNPRTLVALQSIGSCDSHIARVLAGVLSSPCDADKVAYLGLDSQNSGVAYGRGIDLDGLLSGLRMPEEDAQDRWPTLGITTKALAAAEQIVLARYWMIHRVYWHHANRALMAAAKFVIATLMVNSDFDFLTYLADTMNADARGGLQWLSNRFDALRSTLDGPSPLRNPLADLLRGHRIIYKRFVTVSHGLTPGESAERDLYDALRRCSPDRLLELGRELVTEVAKVQINYAVKEGDLIFDVPHKDRERTGGVVSVYADESSAATGELFTVSPLLGELAKSFDQHTKRCRVFVHPELLAALGDVAEAEAAAVRTKAWLAAKLVHR